MSLGPDPIVRTRHDKSEVKESEEESKRSLQNITQNIRRTAEVGLFFAEASGIAIDQVLQLYIESGLRTIEFLSAAIAAETAIGFNWATGKLALQLVAVGVMFAQINALRNQKAENARRWGLAASGLRALTF